jgi:hypothetical protein
MHTCCAFESDLPAGQPKQEGTRGTESSLSTRHASRLEGPARAGQAANPGAIGGGERVWGAGVGCGLGMVQAPHGAHAAARAHRVRGGRWGLGVGSVTGDVSARMAGRATAVAGDDRAGGWALRQLAAARSAAAAPQARLTLDCGRRRWDGERGRRARRRTVAAVVAVVVSEVDLSPPIRAVKSDACGRADGGGRECRIQQARCPRSTGIPGPPPPTPSL